jgi:hypothetical protein
LKPFLVVCIEPTLANLQYIMDFDKPPDDENIPLLPDPPVLEPPPDVQDGIIDAGDRLEHLQGELCKEALEAQKKELVKAFYGEIALKYNLRTREIDYSQFKFDEDGKTLYWVAGNKEIRISTVQGTIKFRGLE